MSREAHAPFCERPGVRFPRSTLPRGWKSGGFNQSVLTTEEASNGMFLQFDPEVLDSVELGVKTRWLDGRLSVDLTGFYSLYDDIQVSSLLLNAEGSVEARIDNAATATIRGFELEARWLLEQDWLPGRDAFASLSGGVGYTDAAFGSGYRCELSLVAGEQAEHDGGLERWWRSLPAAIMTAMSASWE